MSTPTKPSKRSATSLKPSTTPLKRSKVSKLSNRLQENNNNTRNAKQNEHEQARAFIVWYKRMIDDDRYNLGLYIADDAILEWFGRTIKTRKKVTAFMKYHIQCSKHDFTTIESIDRIQSKNIARNNDTILDSPTNSDIDSSKSKSRKNNLRFYCNSPEWAEGCEPQQGTEEVIKTDKIEINNDNKKEITHNSLKRSMSDEDISNKGDGLLHKLKRKCVPVTPPNCEVGQGDCLPSTSGTDSDRSHDALNAQLPKLAVECNGYIEFTRTRNNRRVDGIKWERKCKVQISYSEDPLNTGEYIIWVLRYTDESKCRRNLLAAFEEISNEDEVKKV